MHICPEGQIMILLVVVRVLRALHTEVLQLLKMLWVVVSNVLVARHRFLIAPACPSEVI